MWRLRNSPQLYFRLLMDSPFQTDILAGASYHNTEITRFHYPVHIFIQHRQIFFCNLKAYFPDFVRCQWNRFKMDQPGDRLSNRSHFIESIKLYDFIRRILSDILYRKRDLIRCMTGNRFYFQISIIEFRIT